MPNTESRTERPKDVQEILSQPCAYLGIPDALITYIATLEAQIEAMWYDIKVSAEGYSELHAKYEALEAAPVDGTLVEALKDVRADIEACKKHNDKEGFSTRMSITMKGALAKVDAALAGAAHGWRENNEEKK